MTNTQKLFAQPYGDNLVAKCDECGKPVHLCKCNEEDEYNEEHLGIYEAGEPDTDAFGRNYSNADPGL